MEKSDCLQGPDPGQHEINMEEDSLEGNKIDEEETSIKLDYIKEEVLISSEGGSWSAVLSSPKEAACSINGVLVDPLDNRNNYMYGQNSDTDVDGWINDGIGNTLSSNDNHPQEEGVTPCGNSYQQNFQQAHHENEHGKRQLLSCFHCSGLFSSEGSLVKHMRTHTGESQITARSQVRRHTGTLSEGKGHSQGQKRGRQGPKTTFPWTDEQEEDLVEWWRQNESLYNGNCHGYLNRPRREKLFAAKAKEIGDGCTSEDIQTHLRSLRTKMNHILKDNTGEGWQPRTPRGKWVWDRLHFILPFIIQRNIKSKFGKGSSGEDSPSGGSDVSMGMDTVHVSGTSNDVGPVSSLRDRYPVVHSRSRGRTRGPNVSVGVDTVPGTSNDVGPVSSLRDRYAVVQSRSRGRTRGAKHHIPSKKTKVDTGIQEQLLRTKSTTSNLDKNLMTSSQHTSIPCQPQLSVEVPEAPTTSMPIFSTHRRPATSMPNVSTHQQPTTSTHTQPTPSTHAQPVSSTDEEEVKAFLGHLKCTLLRIPADLRMEVQADILAMVYARHKEHRQSCKQP